jgi:hypothetical protein
MTIPKRKWKKKWEKMNEVCILGHSHGVGVAAGGCHRRKKATFFQAVVFR